MPGVIVKTLLTPSNVVRYSCVTVVFGAGSVSNSNDHSVGNCSGSATVVVTIIDSPKSSNV